MDNVESETIFVTEEEAGHRLDVLLATRFKGLHSRTYFEMLIKESKVLLNGNPVKKRTSIRAGDEIEIQFILTPEINISGEDIPLDIIYEDQHIIVVNKPAGLVVHPAVGNWTGTFVNALIYHCKQLEGDFSSLRPGIVHRLDKETSGLLIAAKTTLAHQRLIEMFSQRLIHKEYLAVVLGNPGDRQIEAPLGRHPVDRQKMAVVATGKSALTICRTLHFNGKISLISLILETGRTHQIRVHMKHIGTPVLGDKTYGNNDANAKYGVSRQLLHASKLTFKHPITNEPLSLVAPMPPDIQMKAEG